MSIPNIMIFACNGRDMMEAKTVSSWSKNRFGVAFVPQEDVVSSLLQESSTSSSVPQELVLSSVLQDEASDADIPTTVQKVCGSIFHVVKFDVFDLF